MANLPSNAVLAQHVAVLGKTRSGKSSVMRLLVEGLLDESKPVCIIDPKGDWHGLRSSADGKHAGYPVVIFGGEHADVPLNEHAGAHVAELVATGNRPCIIDLGGWMVGARTRFFIDFASTLFRLTRGNRWLVIDEVHNFCPQGKVHDPDAGKMLHWANRLASEGSGKGLILVAASQRPQKVHKDFLTSCETLVAMRVIHPLDRGAIKDWIDGCPDAAKGQEVLKSLASLPRGSGWVWSPEIGFGPKVIAFPMFKTYDSFKAPTGEARDKLKGWAEVDLEDVRAKLVTVVEEAKRNDPKELRAEIARLKGEVSKATIAKSPIVDERAITDAEQRGYARGLAETAKELREASSAIGKITQSLPGLKEQIERASAELFVVQLRLGNAADFVPAAPTRRPPMRATSVPQSGANWGTPQPDVQTSGHGREGISRAESRVLDALAELEVLGVERPERVQVAFLAGYTNLNSKGLVNSLGALRSANLIDYPETGTVCLTANGRDRAIFPLHPRSSKEIQERVVRLLGGASERILRPLIEAYPDPLDRHALAETAGYGNLNSKGFVNAIGRLRSLKFIDYTSGRRVVALPVLFAGGA